MPGCLLTETLSDDGLFPHAKAREDLAQEVICRELACNRAEFILGKTEFLCEKLSARCRFASAPERFGNALQSGEVALPRHEHVPTLDLPTRQSEQHFPQTVDPLASLRRDIETPALRAFLRPRRIPREVDLVEHRDRPELFGKSTGDRPIRSCEPVTRVDYQQHRVRLLDGLPGARDADGLYFALGFSKTGRSDEGDR